MPDISRVPSLRSFKYPTPPSSTQSTETEHAVAHPLEPAPFTLGDTVRITPNHGLISPFALQLDAEPIAGSMREKYALGFPAKAALKPMPYGPAVHAYLSTAGENELQRQIRAGERPSVARVNRAIDAEAERLRLPFRQRALGTRYGLQRLSLECETGFARLNARFDVKKAKAKLTA